MDWVLIVDDDAVIRSRTAAILKREDMKVKELSSGEELLDYIEGLTPLPDLILLDIMMPGMNGPETFRALREKGGEAGKIPVIFLTGNDDYESEQEGLKLGAEDFIRKPYFPELLIP